jgi:CRP/FNR family cyclic AMP-dependent transcriptional regulator
MPADDRHDLLRHTLLFAGLNDSELARVAYDLYRCSYAAGEILFHQGDPGAAIYIVETGRVRIYVPTEEGQEISVILYGPGETFGEMALLESAPRSATAEAMEDTVVLAMGSVPFYRHLQENYQVALNLMQHLSRRLRATTDQVRAMASLDVSRRTIQSLLRLAKRQGTPAADGIHLGRLTQQELASLVGTSRESVNRALRALARKELVAVVRGEIVIRQVEALEDLLGEA